MSGIISRYWMRLKGKKNFPHAWIYGEVSPEANIAEGVWIPFGTRVDKRCSIGRYSYIMPPSHLQDVTIGNFCSLAEGISFINYQHNTQAFSTFPFSKRLANHGIDFPALFEESIHQGTIHIGHDVWIGTKSIIMGGIHIGTGSIIGAGSIVTKDIEPYSIVAGVPARTIHKRFDEDTITQLLDTKWWEWPIEKIQSQKQSLINLTNDKNNKVNLS